MPKSAKKAGTRTGRVNLPHATKSDFTLYDFAHCSSNQSPVVNSGRLKKGEVNAFRAHVKEVCGKSVLSSEDSLVWYERDPSDFDVSDEETASSSCFHKIERKGRKAGESQEDLGSNCHGESRVTYPVDVWFLIGRHIHPEDVASFSAICLESHLVVHSARFWSCLYRRFYASTIDLPATFGPTTLERVHGLKSRVIRSLFYFYPPFQNRLRNLVPFANDPDCIEGMRCRRVWYQQIKQAWHFYFKFESLTPRDCPVFPSRNRSRSTDSLRAEADVLYNPEEQSIILQVVLPSYVSLPEVVGQVLIKAFLGVGHDMRSHKLKLIFNPTCVHPNKFALTNGTTISMDPVINIHVLRWWDPKYPIKF